MRIVDVEQGTPEWMSARLSVITGSKAKRVMGTAEAHRNLIAELISEEGTERYAESRKSASMERGNEEEVFAVREYERVTGNKVDRIGFLLHNDFNWLGYSPDGLVKNSKGKYSKAIEIKCPDSKNMILYKIESLLPLEETGLLSKKGEPLSDAPFMGIPAEYKWQVVMSFVVNDEQEELDFITYDARFIGENNRIRITNVRRDAPEMQEAIKELTAGITYIRSKWLSWKEIVLPSGF